MKAIIVRFSGAKLTMSDITDSLSLSRKLIERADPVSRFLVSRLPRKPLQRLARGNGAGLKLSLAALVEELNAIIEGPSIFEERRFAGLSLSHEARELLTRSAKKVTRHRLNRMLLEETYPREIRNHRNPLPGSAELVTGVPIPKMDEGPDSRQVLVKVLLVGIDATDKEINEGKYGRAPEGENYLILGHEVFGRVIKVGGAVTHVKPGDYVTCTVRRNGTSIYDRSGQNDMTADPKYYERGIAYVHGFLTEYFVDEADFIVKVPASIKHLGVLAEPSSVVVKGIEQAYAAQMRLRVWKPRLAFVLGAGQIGLLATLMLKLRGVEVYTLARTRPPCLKAEIATALGAHYVSTRAESMRDLATRVGRPDLIFEATGSSEVAFQAMEVLNLNGVLVWSSITGESSGEEQPISVPANRVNLEWVLGNKTLIGTVNGNAEHFRVGIQNLIVGNEMFPSVLERILSHPVQGLDIADPMEMFRSLGGKNPALKVYLVVSHE